MNWEVPLAVLLAMCAIGLIDTAKSIYKNSSDKDRMGVDIVFIILWTAAIVVLLAVIGGKLHV